MKKFDKKISGGFYTALKYIFNIWIRHMHTVFTEEGPSKVLHVCIFLGAYADSRGLGVDMRKNFS